MIFSIFGKEVFSFTNTSKEKGLLSFDETIRFILDGSGQVGLSIGDAYPNHIWVYAAVNAIARNIARVPYILFNRDTERVITSGPAWNLFNTVSPTLDQSKLWEGTQIFKQIRGESFWLLVEGATGIIEISFLEPTKMSEVVVDGVLNGWNFQDKGQKIFLDTETVMHFRFFNPNKTFRGLNPLTSMIGTIKVDDSSRRFNASVLENGAYPGSIIETEKNLSDPQYQKIQDAFETRHQNPNNAGKVAILEGGLKYKEVRLTAEDTKLIEQRNMNKSEILAGYQVPSAIVGDTAAFNRANMKIVLKQFWEQTLIPELVSMERNIQTNLLDVHFRGITGRFDLTVIPELQEELTEQIDRGTKLFSMGMPFADINERLKLGFKTDDKPWLSQGFLPLNLVSQGGTSNANANNTRGLSVEPMEKFLKNVKAIEDSSKGVNYAKWQKLITQIIPLERKYANELGTWIFGVRQETLNNFFSIAAVDGEYTKIQNDFKNNKDIPLDIQAHLEAKINALEAAQPLFNEVEQLKILRELSAPFISDAIETGGKVAFEEIGFSQTFSLANPNTIKALEVRVTKLKDITDSLRGATRSILIEGVASGDATSTIADNLRSFMNQYKGRSRVIARTEINGAANNGKFLANQDAGVEKHTWFTSGDDRVRASHASINGVTVKIGDLFPNGLLYPGDENGSAAEVVNDRCTTLAEV